VEIQTADGKRIWLNPSHVENIEEERNQPISRPAFETPVYTAVTLTTGKIHYLAAPPAQVVAHLFPDRPLAELLDRLSAASFAVGQALMVRGAAEDQRN
jgi:hypothetical protein